MRKKFFSVLTLFTAVLMLLSANTCAFAVEPRATNYIEVQSSGLTRTTGKDFKVLYSVTTGQTVDQVGVYYIQIQRSTDQQNWTTERTLHYTSYTELVSENSCTHAGSISYAGTRGYYYRARIGFMAKIDGDSEFTYMYTNTIFIPLSGNGGRFFE